MSAEPHQPNPSPDPLEPARQPDAFSGSDAGRPQGYTPVPQFDKAEQKSSGETEGRRGEAYTTPPHFEEKKQTEPVPQKKKSWLMPVVAAVVIAAALVGVMASHQSSSGGSSTPTSVLSHSDRVLTVTGADVDQAATNHAIAELKNGTAGPLLAALPEAVKHEIIAGDRKFYRIPPTSTDGGSSFDSGDRISVDFNGIPYGTYDLSKPITLDMPLRIGDQVGIHCLSVAEGKASLTVDLATVLNPVRSQPLVKGQSQTLSVQSGNAGQNYEWFEQEAAAGNAVAEYGLGHMYQYGLGVAPDKNHAVHWYQQAASQNYLDAKAQLQLLQSNP